jgi:hypothetical protein
VKQLVTEVAGLRESRHAAAFEHGGVQGAEVRGSYQLLSRLNSEVGFSVSEDEVDFNRSVHGNVIPSVSLVSFNAKKEVVDGSMPICCSVCRAQVQLHSSREQLSSLSSSDAAKARLRQHDLKRKVAELEQEAGRMREKCAASEKNLQDSKAAYRRLENIVIDSSKAAEKASRLQIELKTTRAAAKDVEAQCAQRCEILEQQLAESQQKVRESQLKLEQHASCARCDGYRRRSEALQKSLSIEKEKCANLTAKLRGCDSAKTQMIIDELNSCKASLAACELSKQHLRQDLSARLSESQDTATKMQGQDRARCNQIALLQLQLDQAHALNASAAASHSEASRGSALHVSELQSRLEATDRRLEEALRLLDVQVERTALAEMAGGQAVDCVSCARLRQKADAAELKLAASAGSVEEQAREHATTLRHAASALNELQQQLQDARGREAAAMARLEHQEEELKDLKKREEEGHSLRRLHAEAAEVFLQQAEALKSSGEVCLRCLRYLEAGP